MILTEIVEKWLIYRMVEQKPKTQVWHILSRCDEFRLGLIKWYPAWRHYCFIIDLPLILELAKQGNELVYSDRCSLSITNFVARLNAEHKQMKKTKEAL